MEVAQGCLYPDPPISSLCGGQTMQSHRAYVTASPTKPKTKYEKPFFFPNLKYSLEGNLLY